MNRYWECSMSVGRGNGSIKIAGIPLKGTMRLLEVLVPYVRTGACKMGRVVQT